MLNFCSYRSSKSCRIHNVGFDFCFSLFVYFSNLRNKGMTTNNNNEIMMIIFCFLNENKFLPIFSNHSVHECDDSDYHIIIEVHVHVYHS